MPTCHDYFPAADGYDILVGFGTGDGTALATQLPVLFYCCVMQTTTK